MSTWIHDSQFKYPDWQLAGFLDDNNDALKGYNCELPIIGSIQEYRPHANDFFVIGIGAPKIKKNIIKTLEARGAQFLSFVHHSSISGFNIYLGRGCVLCPYSILTCDVKLEDYVTVNCFSDVGHDATISSFTTLSCHVDITGYVKVGKEVLLGSHSCVLPGVEIEDNAIVGAGSIVVHRVKKGTTVFGNPAKVLFNNSSSEE